MRDEMGPNQHMSAFCLALAASTDNFLVGLSEGLGRRVISQKVLWGIAIANAIGGSISSASGNLVNSFISVRHQFLLTAIAFGWLGIQEYREFSFSAKNASNRRRETASLALAAPMTLNNIAGGVTGGIIGISPLWGFFYSLIISVITMWAGYRLGCVGKSSASNSSRTTMFSMLLYIWLSLQSLYEALNTP